MPRRPAPSPLRLVDGPLPRRGKPKHTLPSIPRPAFHPPTRLTEGAAPRERARSFTPEPALPREHTTLSELPPLAIPLLSGSSSPTSSSYSGSTVGRRSRTSSESSRLSGERSRLSMDEVKVHGPWEKHARSFSLPIDINTVVVPPRPVAINPVPVW